MNIQTMAWLFAAIFVVVGVLGFVPGMTSNGMLLGIFMVDTMHNLIHIISGLLAGYMAVTSPKFARMYFKGFGAIYAFVAIVGFIQNDTVLGIISTNMADHVLHVIIATLMLYIGFIMNDKEHMYMSAMGGGLGGGMKM
jgi:hypothetical protein